MTTTTLKCVVKSMVSEIENLRRSEIVSKLIDGVEFITLLSLPILIPFGIIWLGTNGLLDVRETNRKNKRKCRTGDTGEHLFTFYYGGLSKCLTTIQYGKGNFLLQ